MAATAAVACGSTLKRSPITPKSAISKSGASGSLLTTTIPKEVSLVSVTGVDGFHPARMYREKQGKLQKFLDNSSSNVQLRQELEPLYIRDGAFYFFSDELAKTGRLKNDHPDFFIRNFPWNVNIDTNQDLQLARNVNKAQVVNDPNNEF